MKNTTNTTTSSKDEKTEILEELDSYCQYQLNDYGIVHCDCNYYWSCWMHREPYPTRRTCECCGQYSCSCPGDLNWRMSQSAELWSPPNPNCWEHRQLMADRKRWDYWYDPEAYWAEIERLAKEKKKKEEEKRKQQKIEEEKKKKQEQKRKQQQKQQKIAKEVQNVIAFILDDD